MQRQRGELVKAKVDIAFALGLYDRKIRKGLHTVRGIRNKFAHSSEPMEFNHNQVADECRKLDTKAAKILTAYAKGI